MVVLVLKSSKEIRQLNSEVAWVAQELVEHSTLERQDKAQFKADERELDCRWLELVSVQPIRSNYLKRQ
ncbi:hypothetical protein AXF42_Ash009924 [Apostasia shenzhenica]|uniref:Uncharacterized protein n=1 Tax=Apostasia shenzhenica TaxID=1088818 RepID=A0A2I0ACC3_9ASPA|nr:hypothetical protein AXF42_Ash009924 [Apostasia shenzhenica]